METNSYSSIRMTYQDRASALSDGCHHNSSGTVHNHKWFDSVTFLVQSRSLMFCAIPKVATKTVLIAIVYIYLRDISEHLSKNWSNISVNKDRMKQLVNIPSLVKELKKSGVAIQKTSKTISLASLLHICLDVLQFGIINNVSTSESINPWRLSLKISFPDIRLRPLSNLSLIFSPSFTRAMFVRHPFERLASAYKERIAMLEKDRVQPEPEYDAIRRSICHQYTRFNMTRHPLSKEKRCKEVIPSFEDFIRHVLATGRSLAEINRMDYHWQPYSTLCQVCQFKYNFIGKFETFYNDFTYLLKSLNLSDWNIQKPHGASGYTTWDYQQMFLPLPDELICQLTHLYDDDLHLFNYRLEDYVDRNTLICPSRSQI